MDLYYNWVQSFHYQYFSLGTVTILINFTWMVREYVVSCPRWGSEAIHTRHYTNVYDNNILYYHRSITVLTICSRHVLATCKCKDIDSSFGIPRYKDVIRYQSCGHLPRFVFLCLSHWHFHFLVICSSYSGSANRCLSQYKISWLLIFM